MKSFLSFRRSSKQASTPSRAKAVFRCYFLDAVGGIQALEKIETETLDQAVERILILFADRPHYAGFELWQGARRLHTHVRVQF